MDAEEFTKMKSKYKQKNDHFKRKCYQRQLAGGRGGWWVQQRSGMETGLALTIESSSHSAPSVVHSRAMGPLQIPSFGKLVLGITYGAITRTK